ncbi:PD-(D/E)XK nuclease family protein [Candidatus Pacearchaeota archaeon]|nr:PD-(D/E)XK nuclease family protein [Candidatus Pacearchaeota archaeon]
MTLYSHSRISAFEQCRYQYKLKYLDKIPSPVKKTVEAHLGECVHDALEWLYKNVLQKHVPEMDELIEKYSLVWQEKYTGEIVIVNNLSKQDYFNKGIKFLVDYYAKHHPFDDGTLETEKKVWINLEKNFPHKVIGYIDRLVYNKEKNEYEIHDYKTANTLPDRKKFENDRQLALYSIAIKETYGQEKPVVLVWHYLNYNLKIISKRTNEQLENLKKEIVRQINEIESAKEFPPNKSVLCNWCEYKQYCKAWGNSIPKEILEMRIKPDVNSKEKINEKH